MSTNVAPIFAVIELEAGPEDIINYLDTRMVDAHREGRFCRQIDTFYNPETMQEEIEAARNWWPKDGLPTRYQWGYCFMICLNIFGSSVVEVDKGTLIEHLREQAKTIVAFLKAEKRDTVFPNETPADKRRRVGRERVAKWRAQQKEKKQVPDAEPEHIRIARQQVTAMQAQLRSIRTTTKDANRAAYDAMMDVVSKGKVQVAWAEEQVANAERYLVEAQSSTIT